jgi:hypothetical protein
MSKPTGRISQQDAARLMYAAKKWALAAETYGAARATVLLPADTKMVNAAEAAFAELVAGMTRDETE